MDDFLQSLVSFGSLAIVIPFVALLLWYLVIRLAVMHALRDHEKWVENRRARATRRTYPDQQFYRPISPEPDEQA